MRAVIRTADGWPLPDAVVTVLGGGGLQVGRAYSDSAGAVVAVVDVVGPVTVIVAAAGHRPEARAAVVPVHGGCDLGSVVLARTSDGTLPAAGTWSIDPAHSIIRATARHIGLSRIEGRFTQFSGTIHVADPPEDSSVEVTIESASIDTGTADRDAHLRSPDFLDVARFPTLTYRSTRVVRRGDDRWSVEGDLTIRDITRPVPLDVSYVGSGADPWGGTRMAFVATAELARQDYEMIWNMGLPSGLVMVGPTLKIDLDVQAVREPDRPTVTSAGADVAAVEPTAAAGESTPEPAADTPVT